MKKLLFLILGVLVVIVGFFAFSLFYSKSKVDLFFSGDNGSLYDKGGVTWKLNSFASETFNGKYSTEVLLFNETIAVFEHEAKFGLRDFNIFNIGSIETKAKFNKLQNILDPLSNIKSYNIDKAVEESAETEYLFDFLSDIKFSGIDMKIDIKEGSKEFNQLEEFFAFSWKDIKGNYLVSFDRDTVDFNLDVPYVLATINTQKDNTSITIENQKYASHVSKRKVGVWLGDYSTKIDKISIASAVKKEVYSYNDDFDVYGNYYNGDEEEEDYYSNIYEDALADDDYEDDEEEYVQTKITNTNAILSKLDLVYDVKDSDDSTLDSNSKLFLKSLIVDADERNLTLDNIVFDMNLENIDLESTKKLIETLDNINFREDEGQILLLGMSLMGYIPNILNKHPKITLNEFSIKYENQTHKLNGFVQYIGNGDLQLFYKNIKDDIIAKLDINIGWKSINSIIEKTSTIEDGVDNLLSEQMLETLKDYGFKFENDIVKGALEYKNGHLLINNNQSIPIGSIF